MGDAGESELAAKAREVLAGTTLAQDVLLHRVYGRKGCFVSGSNVMVSRRLCRVSTPHEVARAVVDENTSGHVLTAFSWAKFDRVAKYKALFSKLRVAPVVSDAEAEAAADATCGAPVGSAVSRAYVGPRPEQLAKRFPIMGGRR